MKGTVSGSGTDWTLTLDSVMREGEISVTVSDFEPYIITNGPKTVTVYKNPNTQPTHSSFDIAVINGIIDKHPELDLSKADPADGFYVPKDWNQYIEWDNSLPKQIKEIDMKYLGLIGALDISGLQKLERLYFNKNQLSSLTVGDMPLLNYLDCGFNRLSSLNMSNLPALENLIFKNNRLTLPDFYGLTNLRILDCGSNQLSGRLDVSALKNLKSLYCSYNSLTGVVLSGEAAYDAVDVSYNSMASDAAVENRNFVWNDSEFIFSPQYENCKYVTFSAEQIGGIDGKQDSAAISLVFDTDMTALSADKISVEGPVTTGTLEGSGKNWRLNLSNVSEGGLCRSICAPLRRLSYHEQSADSDGL